MQGKIIITKGDSSTQTIDIISCFSIKVGAAEKYYYLSTANEVDQNGLIKILASEVSGDKLLKIESQDEWTLVKNVMRSIISSSVGDFEYVNFGDEVKLTTTELEYGFARIIAIQDSAKDQLVKDYLEKRPDVSKPGEVKEEVQDPNAGIYPSSDTNEQTSEVIPGISEVSEVPEGTTEDVAPVVDAPVEQPQEETPVEETSEPVPTEIAEPAAPIEEPAAPVADIEEPAVPVTEEPVQEEVQQENPEPAVVTEDVSAVASVEPAPETTIPSADGGDARQILINKITEAVDEYVNSLGLTKSDDTEINALKTSISTMQEQLKQMSESLQK